MALKRYRLWEEPPALEWHVAGWLPKRELTTLAGLPGSGKSIISAELAVATASGGLWLGRTVSPGAVLFVATEAEHSTRRRLWDAAPDLDHPIIPAGGEIDLRADRAFDEIAAEIDGAAADLKRKIDLVILDSIPASTRTADENSAKDMGLALATLQRVVREKGVTMLALGHPAKGGGDVWMRGSSGQAADVAAHWSLTGTEGVRTLTGLKQRDGVAGLSIAIDIGTDDAGRLRATAAEAGHADAIPHISGDADKALRALRDLGPGRHLIRPDWRTSCEEAMAKDSADSFKSAFSTAQRQLREAGLIVIEGDIVEAVSGRKHSVRNYAPRQGRGGRT